MRKNRHSSSFLGEEKSHYKMWKKKKSWVYGATTVAMLGIGLAQTPLNVDAAENDAQQDEPVEMQEAPLVEEDTESLPAAEVKPVTPTSEGDETAPDANQAGDTADVESHEDSDATPIEGTPVQTAGATPSTGENKEDKVVKPKPQTVLRSGTAASKKDEGDAYTSRTASIKFVEDMNGKDVEVFTAPYQLTYTSSYDNSYNGTNCHVLASDLEDEINDYNRKTGNTYKLVSEEDANVFKDGKGSSWTLSGTVHIEKVSDGTTKDEGTGDTSSEDTNGADPSSEDKMKGYVGLRPASIKFVEKVNEKETLVFEDDSITTRAPSQDDAYNYTNYYVPAAILESSIEWFNLDSPNDYRLVSKEDVPVAKSGKGEANWTFSGKVYVEKVFNGLSIHQAQNNAASAFDDLIEHQNHNLEMREIHTNVDNAFDGLSIHQAQNNAASAFNNLIEHQNHNLEMREIHTNVDKAFNPLIGKKAAIQLTNLKNQYDSWAYYNVPVTFQVVYYDTEGNKLENMPVKELKFENQNAAHKEDFTTSGRLELPEGYIVASSKALISEGNDILKVVLKTAPESEEGVLDDGIQVKTQVDAIAFINQADYYDYTKVLPDGTRVYVKSSSPAAVSVDAKDYYENKAQVGKGISVTPEDYYETKTQTGEAVSVTADQYYDNTQSTPDKPAPLTDKAPIAKAAPATQKTSAQSAQAPQKASAKAAKEDTLPKMGEETSNTAIIGAVAIAAAVASFGAVQTLRKKED